MLSQPHRQAAGPAAEERWTSQAPTPQHVHRVSERDVLIAGWTRHDDLHYTVYADWTRPHCFFRLPGTGDPCVHMLVEQTIRQAVLAITHAEFGVPVTHQFMMNRFSYRLDPLRPPDPAQPVQARIEFARTGRRTMDTFLTFTQAGTVFGTSSNALGWIDQQVYRRLRGDRADCRPHADPTQVPLETALAGRRDASEVVLARDSFRGDWGLRPCPGHPALIDHDVDHVPGLVLLEAARQAASASALPYDHRITTADLRPDKYVEFDAPCWLTVSGRQAEDGTPLIEVTGVQESNAVFRCLMETAPAPARTGARPTASPLAGGLTPVRG